MEAHWANIFNYTSVTETGIKQLMRYAPAKSPCENEQKRGKREYTYENGENSMDSDRYEELLHEILLGNASDEEKLAVEQREAQDPEFREFARSARRFAQLADSLPRIEVSEDFTARVMAAAERESRHSSRVGAFHSHKRPFREVLVDFVPRSKFFVISLAVNAAILLMFAFIFLSPPKTGSGVTSVAVLTGTESHLSAQRSNASRYYTAVDASGRINVAGLGVTGTLYVIRNREREYHFLVAYSLSQWKKLSPELKDVAFPAMVVNGHIRLSKRLLENGLASPVRVTLLAMNDRYEIWNGNDFACYLKSNTGPV